MQKLSSIIQKFSNIDPELKTGVGNEISDALEDLEYCKKEYDEYHAYPKGCYVATCVYGSYDCPQVWTLRRFRDNTLESTLPGRCFIHLYYIVSPVLVKWFGQTKLFNSLWKPILDRMVRSLNQRGVENTPYDDTPNVH